MHIAYCSGNHTFFKNTEAFMIGGLLKNLFGTVNDRVLRKMQPDIDAINALEAELEALDEEALRARTSWFRERLENGETLDDILVEAFATVREAAKRTLGQRHYDVQLLGGMVLHQGKITEMKTGEGKTLVSPLPIYLNAIEGKGVHVVTVNDYLAKRDSEWMGQVYKYLGMTVGCIVHGIEDTERQIDMEGKKIIRALEDEAVTMAVTMAVETAKGRMNDDLQAKLVSDATTSMESLPANELATSRAN